jgi:hypothetical protein
MQRKATFANSGGMTGSGHFLPFTYRSRLLTLELLVYPAGRSRAGT